MLAVTSVSLAFAAALTAWGPVVPAPEAASPVARDEAAAASSGAELAKPAAPVATSPVAPPLVAPPLVAPPPVAPPPVAPAPVQTPIIAKAPVNVQAAPVLVATPETARSSGGDLHKQWWFWTIAGGCFALVIVATLVATRPGPQPYTGNAPPYYVPFP